MLTEYAQTHVDASTMGDPAFWGAYATVSYVLTGEHRPYAAKAGYARRVLPQHKWGAVELFVRYSRLDQLEHYLALRRRTLAGHS